MGTLIIYNSFKNKNKTDIIEVYISDEKVISMEHSDSKEIELTKNDCQIYVKTVLLKASQLN